MNTIYKTVINKISIPCTTLSIPGQTLISGAGSDSIHLVFSVEAPTDLVRISGSIDPAKFYLTQNALKGQNIIYASGNTFLS